MYTKYEILINTLDYICQSAPRKYDKYRESETDEQKHYNRSLAYIHLFLLVKFGIQSFEERCQYITDGSYDGGLDAYYIDSQKKTIYLIQAKLRANELNYENKDIDPEEIASMEYSRILNGEKTDEEGHNYNGKILAFQKRFFELDARSLYKYQVVILANLSEKENKKVAKALLKEFQYEVFDYEKAYEELIYPYCSSTFFQNGDIIIDENINGVIDDCSTNFEKTSFGKCTVQLLFVPATYIGKIVRTYKNSILFFNPRNYLSMEKNTVNKSIKAGINDASDDFALMNNGITIVCSNCYCSKLNGLKDSTNIRLENPQIINGGQTAFTISRIMEEEGEKKLEGKKVLLKIISTYYNAKEESSHDTLIEFERVYREFVNRISNATNFQTKIEDSDRRSNMQIQIDFQSEMYDKYGLFYERKSGEFEEVLHHKIIKRDQVIPRDIMVRAIAAFTGDSSGAMNDSKNDLFSEENVKKSFDGSVPIHLALYAYLVYSYAKSLEKVNKAAPNKSWGNGVKYGKYAIVAVAGICLKDDISDYTYDEMVDYAQKTTTKILSKWKSFEKYSEKRASNKAYFENNKNDYVNYYKNGNSSDDIKRYWKDKKIS